MPNNLSKCASQPPTPAPAEKPAQRCENHPDFFPDECGCANKPAPAPEEKIEELEKKVQEVLEEAPAQLPNCPCHCHHAQEGKTCLKPSPETEGMRNVCKVNSCEHCAAQLPTEGWEKDLRTVPYEDGFANGKLSNDRYCWKCSRYYEEPYGQHKCPAPENKE